MILLPIEELSIIGVYDRGIANMERIAIYINQSINMGQYGLMLGIRAEGSFARPIRDNLLWFGDGLVSKGDWLFVYTGPGTATTSNIPNLQERIYSLHWGRQETLFHNQEIVPMLIRFDAVQIPIENLNLIKK